LPPATLSKRANTYDETQFDMPRIAQAKAVLWFPDRHLPDCYTALVCGVATRAIDIAIILPDQVHFHIKTGVRHRSDPDGDIIDRTGNGVWDFPEDDATENLVNIARLLKGLGERVERLEKK
jgi:hypothetical protein